MVDAGIADTVNWGVGTAVTLGVAGMAMKGMGRLTGARPRRLRLRRRRK